MYWWRRRWWRWLWWRWRWWWWLWWWWCWWWWWYQMTFFLSKGVQFHQLQNRFRPSLALDKLVIILESMLSCVFLLYHEKLLSHPHFWLDSFVPSTSPILPQLSPTDRPLYNTRHWPNSYSNHFQLYDILSQRVYIYIYMFTYLSLYLYIRLDIHVYILLHIYIYTYVSVGLLSPVIASHPLKHLDITHFHGAKCLGALRCRGAYCWSVEIAWGCWCTGAQSVAWLDLLVGGLEHFLFSIIYGIILPID